MFMYDLICAFKYMRHASVQIHAPRNVSCDANLEPMGRCFVLFVSLLLAFCMRDFQTVQNSVSLFFPRP